MNLLITLRSEILKTKRTASFYITLISAALVPAIFLLNALTDDEMDGTSKDPLNMIFKLLSEMNGVAFFPWFIILICTMLPQIEYKNNTWKQVFASPQTKANVFIARFMNIHLLILIFLVATHLFLFLSIVAINFIKPSIEVFKNPLDVRTVLINAANSYILMLAVGTIQYWIGLRFRNFFVPIGIGLALWLTGTMMALQFNSSLSYYFPYSFQAFPMSSKLQPHITQIAWTSAGYAILFLIIGFLDFRRRMPTK